MLALLFARPATLREVHSAYPDAEVVDDGPSRRERRAARLRARSAARTDPAGRPAVRSAGSGARAV
jgi:hypothetical protein